MTLFEYMDAARQERRWTIPQFARECGVSAQLGYKWFDKDEQARITPSPASCEKIASALGVDPDEILELAGHRRARGPRAIVSARRQAVRDQVDRWMAAVGPEHEETFWNALKAQGDTTVALIVDVGTAVNAVAVTAVNSRVNRVAPSRRAKKTATSSPLSTRQHTSAGHQTYARNHRRSPTAPCRKRQSAVKVRPLVLNAHFS